MKCVEIFEHCFLCTGYAYDTKFFLKDSQSIAYLVELLSIFSRFFRIDTKSNKMQNSGNKGPNRGSIGSRWYEMH